MSGTGRAELISKTQWFVGRGLVGHSQIQCLDRDKVVSISISFACVLELGGVVLRPKVTLGLQGGFGIWQGCLICRRHTVGQFDSGSNSLGHSKLRKG